MTREFVTTLYGAAEMSVVKGRNVKDTVAATREAMRQKVRLFRNLRALPPGSTSPAPRRGLRFDDPVIGQTERDRPGVGSAASEFIRETKL